MESSTNDFVLTDEIVSSLKCSLCSHYLSYPPIYIISQNEAKYKCGRCTVHSRFTIRATMYENLAQHMKFPCIYKNCTEKLSWADVRDHETVCEHRTLPCIALDCHENIPHQDFAAHFKAKHSKHYFENTVSRDNIHGKSGYAVVEKEGKCYVVLYDNDQEKFRICVSALESPDKQFDLVFTSKEIQMSITVNQQNIIPFNEKSHCYKCLAGECKSDFHIFRHHRRGMLKYNTKVERDLIKRTFGAAVVTCTLNIVDERQEVEDELDELLLGKDVVIDEVKDEEEVEEGVKEAEQSAVDKMLVCPGCEQQMAPPIFECLVGHTMCNSCKSKSGKCATCDALVENTRNYILEEVVANLKLVDQEQSEKTAPDDDMEIICPMTKCTEKIKLYSISNHFKENHLTNFHFNTLSISDIYGYYNVDVLVKDDKTYLVFFDFNDSTFGISVCSLMPDLHRYDVKLLSENKKYVISATNQKIILFNEKVHCAKCSIGVCKNTDHPNRRKRKLIFRNLTTKLNRDLLRRAFKCNILNYKIDIVQPLGSPHDKIFRQLFECPICKDYMVPPIHQCIAGHTLCHVCKSKLDKCPSCEAKIDETRNYFLEKMAETVELPCLYESESCVYRGGVKRVASHELECPLKTKKACREVKTD